MEAILQAQNKINVDHSQVKPLVISTWYLQTAFWVVLTVVTFFSLTLWYGSAEWPHVAHTVLQSLIGFLLTLCMQWLYRKVWLWQPLPFFSFVTVVVLLFSLIWSVLRVGAFIWLTAEGSEVWADFGGWYFSGFFIFLCWTALFYSLQYYRLASDEKDRRIKQVEKSRVEKVKRLEAEKLAAEARMQMLRYQLNPHFLFNTLNAVNALIVTQEPQQARTMVDKLSQFLRYALKDDKKGWVDLASEIEALELYLSIEKVRFGERLVVDYDIQNDALQFDVPSLLLQPLVENSIKYAINVSESGGTIAVKARCNNDYLCLLISDDGPGIPTLESGELSAREIQFEGVGLKNIVDRLENLYGDQASIKLINSKNKGLEVQLTLPIKHR